MDNENYIEAVYYANKGISASSGYKLNNTKTLPLLYLTKCIGLYKLNKHKEAKKCALYTYHILQVFCTPIISQEILLELYKNTEIKFEKKFTSNTLVLDDEIQCLYRANDLGKNVEIEKLNFKRKENEN